jgi:uncharacterized protein
MGRASWLECSTRPSAYAIVALVGDAPFYEYSAYLKSRYGSALRRIAVDAGFSCPNRSAGASGCAYCAGDGNRAAYQGDAAGRDRGRPDAMRAAVREQVLEGIARMSVSSRMCVSSRMRGAERFVLYFQAYTGTYAPPSLLEELYATGLSLGNFAELVVATRPDCVDGPVADLLASFKGRVAEVWVELGLQSSNDASLRRVGRGHGAGEFAAACALLRRRGVKTAAHVIFGLPGEGRAEMRESVRFAAAQGIDGIKFHDLQVPRTSALFSTALRGETVLISRQAYLNALAEAIELLPPWTVVMRLACELNSGDRALPLRPWDKASLKRDLARELERRGRAQGSAYVPGPA